MYTKSLEGQIIFYYPHSTLFDEVQHQSAFMCKNIVAKEGEDLSERFAITDDEEPMFALCLDETIPGIYDTIKVLTHGIEDAIHSTITGAGIKAFGAALASLDVDDDANYVAIRIVDNEAYNPNTVKLVDSALRTSIESGVLSSFYTRVTHPEITKLSATMFMGQIQALAMRIIPLRKKTAFPY